MKYILSNAFKLFPTNSLIQDNCQIKVSNNRWTALTFANIWPRHAVRVFITLQLLIFFMFCLRGLISLTHRFIEYLKDGGLSLAGWIIQTLSDHKGCYNPY